MSNPRYPEEFKIQAVNQVTEKKLPVTEVAARLGVSARSRDLARAWRSASSFSLLSELTTAATTVPITGISNHHMLILLA